MLNVAGGTYYEYCAEPERKYLFGSGLRGAAAVARHTKVKLYTFATQETEPNILANARAFNVAVEFTRCIQQVRFDYLHPLATPNISPPVGFITQSNPITVKGDAILVFGMLEGTAKVDGSRVVYDPQSPFAPKAFSELNSKAGELAIVLNGREATLLARKNNLDEAARYLLSESGASVIVVKRGTHGASVYTGKRKSHVPAYRTERIWKIGSGDVFAAIFANFWAVQKDNPHEAAMKASAAAAIYCENQILPLPKNFENPPNPLTILQPISNSRIRKPQVYLAGPFFTMAERWLIHEARKALQQQGIKVFSPLHDVGHGEAVDVAVKDLEALKKSQAVFAIIDGVDSGTVFEVGYATARGIPTVAFVQNEKSENLKMLEGSGCDICSDFTTAVYHTIWAAVCK